MAPQVRELKIRNKYGIHARPAAMFVKTAGSYDAEVTVEKEGMKVSGKSIMGLLTLEGYKGCVLRVSAEGPDACEALDALQDLIDNNFFED
ncbi:MAG: HPr family phosphocarrier protein [Spartobacteria bacterium]|nr:HPr family phosphocarrier protein [Spartobacteria bacterium]